MAFDTQLAFNQSWRPAKDDMVGGWCIVLDTDESEGAEGGVTLGTFLDRTLAEYICALHNWAYSSGESGFISDELSR